VNHDCIGYVYQANANVWDLGKKGSTEGVKITPRHRTNDNRFLRHLALQGRGLVQLPKYFVADDIDAGRLVSVLDRYRDESRSIFVVYPNRAHLPPKVRVLVDHLTRAFGRERRFA